ncbi:MAG: TSUP family transporter, partial [Terrimicrobiaceae bacterium]
LAAFGLMGLHHIHEMNALKTVLATLINLVAAAYFVYAGLIVWPQALVMTLGSTVGYFAGARFAQLIPQQRVRQIIMGIGLAISVVMFWKQFFG